MNIRSLIRECLTPEAKEVHWERIGYTPHAGAVDIHASAARFKTLTCGRRFGKTVAGVREVGPLVFIPDAHIWIVAPTKEVGVKEFRLFQHDLQKLQRGGYLRLRKNMLDIIGGRYLLEVKNGATIEIRTQEKEDQMVGEGLVAVLMAEAARLKPHIWTELIRPTLGDYRGVAVFSTTPRGRNWYYDLVQAAGDNPEWATFQKPSWVNPIVFPGAREDPEILELERSLSKTEFDQEVGAEFTSHSGLVYEDFDIKLHVRQFELVPDVPVNGWVDVGFSDPFVCLATQVLPSGQVLLHDEYYRERMTPSEHAAIMADWFVRPDGVGVVPEVLYCDPRSPDGIKDLKRAGWQAKAAPALDRRANGDNPVIVGVKRVKRLLRVDPLLGAPRLLVHPRCKMTIKEFGLYEWVNGQPDPKKNNHCCFPAGTLVATPAGDCAIENLRPGDAVLTHLGVGRVVVAAPTGTRRVVTVRCGKVSVRCTPDHPFATVNEAWIPAGGLEGACLLRKKPQKSRSTGVRSTFAILYRPIRRTTISSGPSRSPRTVTGESCTKSSGKMRTVLSPMVMRFTTAMRTRPTTVLKIWSWCGLDFTLRPITKPMSPRPARRRRLGTLRLRAWLGIVNTHARPALAGIPFDSWSANNVERPSRPSRAAVPASAPMPASPAGDALLAWMTRHVAVSSAANHSPPTATTRRELAPVDVEASWRPAGVSLDDERPELVYNLATSDGTYFANGFLVSNCDALRYGCLAEVDRGHYDIFGHDEDDERDESDILGNDGNDASDDFDPDEPFWMQRTRERAREKRRDREERRAEVLAGRRE